MAHFKKAALSALQWALVVLLLSVLAFAIWIAEDKLDRTFRWICPAGRWHTGLYWAHCAYPPISIAKFALMYGAYACVGLLVVKLAAPAFKQLVSCILLFALMALPAYHLLLVKFSWVETSKLLIVSVIALVFALRARKGSALFVDDWND